MTIITVKKECVDEFCVVDGTNIKGTSLAATLNRRINAMVTNSRSRSDIIASMSSAAGISVSTVNQILQGSINCPPLRRLRGFARVLNVSSSSLVTSARQDGCNYDTDGENIGTVHDFKDTANSIREGIKKLFDKQ